MMPQFQHGKPLGWRGTPPKTCQLCNRPLKQQFVDGANGGPWAIMCPSCHHSYGVGIGTGRGQRYDLQTLLKVEG